MSFWNDLITELEQQDITPGQLADYIGHQVRQNNVRLAVAASNRETDRRNRERLNQPCSVCGRRLEDDGHGGICPVCEE